MLATFYLSFTSSRAERSPARLYSHPMRAQDLNFDVDHYINPLIPRNRLHRLPEPISRFLGYRNSAPPRIGNVFVWWWAFIGAFAGLLVVEAVFHTSKLRSEGTPIVIASLVSSALTFSPQHTPNKKIGCSSNTGIPHNRVSPLSTSQCGSGPNIFRNRRNQHHKTLPT